MVAPDNVRDRFRENTNVISGDDDQRSLRGLKWQWDPDPGDEMYMVEYAFVLRNGTDVTVVHDRHLEGLFSRATWQRLLTSVGYVVDTFERPLDDDSTDEVFVCRRP